MISFVKETNKLAEWIVIAMSGVFVAELSSWVSPFTNSMPFEYLYLALTICVGAIAAIKLRTSFSPSFRLFVLLIWFLLIYSSKSILFLLIGHYDAGWNLFYLLPVVVGFAMLSQRNSSVLFSATVFVAGFLLAILVPQYLLLKAVLTVGLLMTVAFGTNTLIHKITLVLFLIFTPLLSVSLDRKDDSLHARQRRYTDQLIYTGFSRQNKIDVTTWKGNYWYYINNQNRLSSLDEYLYHEPFVHPAMQAIDNPKRVLILGGETGGVLREVVKYQELSRIDLLPLDFDLLKKFRQQKQLQLIGKDSWLDQRVTFLDEDVFKYLNKSASVYDLIIVDLPDPVDLLHNQFYTKEFYQLCADNLGESGILVTQAGSPYFATKAFYSIVNTVKQAGFASIPYHNQILTLGEWGWVIGLKKVSYQEKFKRLSFEGVDTKWINKDALQLMLSFGKVLADTSDIRINEIKRPSTYQYYQAGNWAFK